jgi:hypothetical protein
MIGDGGSNFLDGHVIHHFHPERGMLLKCMRHEVGCTDLDFHFYVWIVNAPLRRREGSSGYSGRVRGFVMPNNIFEDIV